MSALPELGLGTAALGLATEAEADRALRYALDHDIRYFDAAPLYAGGVSEYRLGQALRSSGFDGVKVSTKVGRYRDWGAEAPRVTGKADIWDFSEKATRSSIARSQERLGREHLDCVFLHDIEPKSDEALCEALPVLQELAASGVIGLVGAGCNTVEGLLAAITAGADGAVLVAGRWTLLDRSAEQTLLPLCQSKQTQVVAGGVLNSGLLAKRPVAGAKFDYRAVEPTELSAAHQLFDVADTMGVSMISAALQFPARSADVGTLLLGVSSCRQLEASLTALSQDIPPELWEAVAPLGLGR